MRSFATSGLARIAIVAAVFSSGYVCGASGTWSDRAAQAQVAELGAEALKGAGGLGTVGELGTSIVEMEQHVSGLQKNIETLKKVKAALGG